MHPDHVPPGGRISGTRLATLLGSWRAADRRGATDLAAAIELQVRDGRLALGTRLPAERELAAAVGASRTLVTAALDRLRDKGIVSSRRGSGSWVAAPGRAGVRTAAVSGSDLIDLTHAAPPAVDGLLDAVDAARARLPAETGWDGYLDRGLPRLRERIADRYTARGLPTTPAQVMVTNGAHHAFVLALRMLAGPGDRVLVEQPCYPNTLAAIRGAHAVPVPVAVDPDHGWDLGGIEAALRQAAPRLAHAVVDFQNPTGHRMSSADRARFGSALRRARTPVVVDETLAELDLAGDPVDGPPPLAAFAGEAAVTVGSASKSHWGGLRLGWIRAGEDLLARLDSTRYALDLGTPVFEQLVLAELLDFDDGDRDRDRDRGHGGTDGPGAALRRRRLAVREWRDGLVAAVATHCPQWTYRLPSGGLALWCRLPEPVSTRLAVAAASRGVHLVPGSRFGAHGGLERWVRLPYTQPSAVLAEAVRRIASAADGLADVPATAAVEHPVR